MAALRRHKRDDIGVEPRRILADLKDLLGDVGVQTGDPQRPAWPRMRSLVRFHRRLLIIHPIPNGNGRPARLAADLLAMVFSDNKVQRGEGGDVPSSGTDAHLRY